MGELDRRLIGSPQTAEESAAAGTRGSGAVLLVEAPAT